MCLCLMSIGILEYKYMFVLGAVWPPWWVINDHNFYHLVHQFVNKHIVQWKNIGEYYR